MAGFRKRAVTVKGEGARRRSLIVSGPSAMKMEEGRCGEGPSDFSPRKMSTRGSSSEVIFTYGTFKVVGSIVDRYICHVIVIEDHRDLSVRRHRVGPGGRPRLNRGRGRPTIYKL